MVNTLHEQLLASSISFEILVVDDCSDDRSCVEVNQSIRQLSNTRFIQLDKNCGRSFVRNYLIQQANGEFLLFLDGDVFPCTNDFIQHYLSKRHAGDVIVGGLRYREQLKDERNALRWRYGVEREALLAKERKRKPYSSFMSGNFLINAKVFSRLRFDESLKKYGHEDTLLGLALKKDQYTIKHIDNPVFHDGLESNEVFLEKTRIAVENLYQLITNHPAATDLFKEVKLLKLYKILQSILLNKPVARWFHRNEKQLATGLCSGKLSLRYLDWYKLGYLCQISLQKHA
ncbi:glycosyltransferase involved in cell wall biosynthesis [Roseimarinus sediminis]